MKTLIFTVDYRPYLVSGIATYTYEIAINLHNLGEDIIVLAPSMKGAREFDKKQNFKTIRFPNILFLRELLLFLYVPFFVKKYRIKNIINIMWFPCGVISLFTYFLFRTPYFVCAMAAEIAENVKVHPSLKHKIRSRLKFLKKLSFIKAKKIFSISSYTKKMLIEQGVDSNKIIIIPGGVNIKDFNPSIDTSEIIKKYNLKNKKIILTVARLDFYKGIDTVIKSLKKIILNIPDIVYIIIGEGPEENNLKKLVKEFGLEENVVFAGVVPQKDIGQYYSACDLFIMASQEIKESGEIEGFGIVYLEANACGKPVIGGRTGGTIDAIIDGETGILLNPKSEEEISQAIIKLLSDVVYAKRLGENGRKRVENELTWDKIAERIKKEID